MKKAQVSATSLGQLLLWGLTAPTVVGLALLAGPHPSLRAESMKTLAESEIPATLPAGTTLSIHSSEAMRSANEALQSRFAQQYDSTPVEIDYQSTDQSIQALMNGNTDLAAIGRSLTDAEEQQGLAQVPLSRHKIAIFTGPDNPFDGSLTVEQFAQIFRGEITNWSEVGGPDAPIVVIDRPASSDTRQAFRNYPVFQNAPLEVAANAVVLDDDETQAVIEETGSNTISYAIAEQVLGNPAVKILPMHDTLPDDPRYPFSQPLSYVYQSDNPSPAALAFLGYATNPDNEAAIEAARAAAGDPANPEELPVAQEPVVEEDPVVAEEPVAVEEPVTEEGGMVEAEPAPLATGRTGGVPWWPWLLALPVLGGLLWWLLKDRTPVAAPLASGEPERRIILTPRNCRDAYAYWELPESEVAALKRQQCTMALRLHDVTDLKDVNQQSPHSMKQFDCDIAHRGDRHLPIGFDDRDYLVELGYLDPQANWHALVRSAPVRVPACPSSIPPRGAGTGAAARAAGLTAAGLTAAASTAAASTRQVKGPSPVVPPLSDAPDKPVTKPRLDLVNQGTDRVAKSARGASDVMDKTLAGGAAMVAGTGAAARALTDQGKQALGPALPVGAGVRSDLGVESRIILVPRSSDAAYAYWEVAPAHREAIRRQGGRTMVLRIHDATNLELDYQSPHGTQEYRCQETAQDQHVTVPTPGRDYVAELGYLTATGEWLRLLRSRHVRVG